MPWHLPWGKEPTPQPPCVLPNVKTLAAVSASSAGNVAELGSCFCWVTSGGPTPLLPHSAWIQSPNLSPFPLLCGNEYLINSQTDVCLE